MTCKINADTTDGLKLISDTSGEVDIQNNGTTVATANSTGITMASGKRVFATGTVLQVVQGRTKTLFTTSSGTMADIGLTAAITPLSSSSSILVICNINGIFLSAVAGSFVSLILLRGSTNVTGDVAAPYLGYPVGYNSAAVTRSTAQTFTYLDSPSTTDATTYKVQAAQVGGVTVNFQRDGQVYSTIQLLEIAG